MMLPTVRSHSSSTACRRAASTCCNAILAPACCSSFSSAKRSGRADTPHHACSPAAVVRLHQYDYYGTAVLLRIPKSAVWRGFRPCFGFRRRAFAIPKKAGGPFFGIVDRILLWITCGGGDALVGRRSASTCSRDGKGASGQHQVVRDLLEGVGPPPGRPWRNAPSDWLTRAQVVGVRLHGLERCRGSSCGT